MTLTSEGIHELLIPNAGIATIGPLLIPDAGFIRLYNHWPKTEISWWEASVPLSSRRPNKRLKIQSLSFDVEFSRTEFLEILDELDRSHGGMTLVQSKVMLPGDMHPQSFRKPETYLRTLQNCGACLLYELPHQNETAGLTLFSDEDLDFLVSNKLISD